MSGFDESIIYEVYEVTGEPSNFTYKEAKDEFTWSPSNLSFLPLVILIIWTFIGNALVLIAVYRERGLKSMSNYVIASLAIADLLLSLLVMPLGLVSLVSTYSLNKYNLKLLTPILLSVPCGIFPSVNRSYIHVYRDKVNPTSTHLMIVLSPHRCCLRQYQNRYLYCLYTY